MDNKLLNSNYLPSAFININLYDLSTSDILELSNLIRNNLQIKTLKNKINEACITLSSVGSPSFGADVTYIALDNQQRLEIINALLNKYNNIELYIQNLRYNKYDCRNNYEYNFMFLQNIQELMSSISSYVEFRFKEKVENELLLFKNVQKQVDALPENLSDSEKMDRLLTGLKDTLSDVVDILKSDKENENE